MTFLFVSSQLCRQLPSDIPSRVCPCLRLEVVVSRICKLTIWTLVLLQGTFTPLIHAHAGRTLRWSGTEFYAISYVSKFKSVRSTQGRYNESHLLLGLFHKNQSLMIEQPLLPLNPTAIAC